MSNYQAPLEEMTFLLKEVVNWNEISASPVFSEFSEDTVTAVLSEAARFSAEVLAPLNRVGDLHGAKHQADGSVVTAPGWRQAYQQFTANGWNGLACSPEFGGQGLPQVVATLVDEMWNSANTAFTLCPLLTRGAIESLELRGSEVLKQRYLPHLVSGRWSGTMNLTEPQAGSDLAAIRSQAIPQGDGSYRLKGQKIFITYGEHDLTENIIHLVLARLPNAPPGVKGISLFLVPKFLVKDDGSLGERNEVRCVSLEHKLGIHSSPTAVLSYGDDKGAVAYLVGEEHRGLEIMFITMNLARFAVGLEGVGLCELAYQKAWGYANERIQGSLPGSHERVAIARHPDVLRMLKTMRCLTEASRAVAVWVGAQMDVTNAAADAARRDQARALVELLIPVVKGWSTELAVEVSSLGIQVHGGMGFIEETGVAQIFRDARITPIYEGTTGIQALDLVGRKLARDKGAALQALAALMLQDLTAAAAFPVLTPLLTNMQHALGDLQAAATFIAENAATRPTQVLAGATPFLHLLGVVCGGWLLTKSAAIAAGKVEGTFYQQKVNTALFYGAHVLPRSRLYSHAICHGGDATLA